MVQVIKTHIILCWMIFHSIKSKNVLILGFTTSKLLENSLIQLFICFHTTETNFHVTVQQWQNDGSSMKNTYHLCFDDFALNQMQKWFDIWIQHIKTVGNHSLLLIHMLPHTRNYFPSNFTAVTTSWFR